MKTLLLISVLNAPSLAYNGQVRVEDPAVVIKKFDNLFSFKDINVSLQGLNDFKVTKKLVQISALKFEGYGNYNLSKRNSESGMRVKLKW